MKRSVLTPLEVCRSVLLLGCDIFNRYNHSVYVNNELKGIHRDELPKCKTALVQPELLIKAVSDPRNDKMGNF
jgi:hypothetical protein